MINMYNFRCIGSVVWCWLWGSSKPPHYQPITWNTTTTNIINSVNSNTIITTTTIIIIMRTSGSSSRGFMSWSTDTRTIPTTTIVTAGSSIITSSIITSLLIIVMATMTRVTKVTILGDQNSYGCNIQTIFEFQVQVSLWIGSGFRSGFYWRAHKKINLLYPGFNLH